MASPGRGDQLRWSLIVAALLAGVASGSYMGLRQPIALGSDYIGEAAQRPPHAGPDHVSGRVAPVDAAAFLGHTLAVHLATYVPATERGARSREGLGVALAGSKRFP
jgi:hypothetical protein